MVHLVALQQEYGKKIAIIGVTEAPVEGALEFAATHGVTYHVLADARADREAYGIELIWGNQVYLVDPGRKIVASGPDEVDAYLTKHFG